MKRLGALLLVFIGVIACEEERNFSSLDPVIWKNRAAHISFKDSPETGETYLSI